MYWHTRVVTVTVAQNKPAHFSIRMHSLGSNEVIMKSLHTRPLLYLTRALPSCFVTLPPVVYQSYIYEYANVRGGIVCRTRKPRFSFVDTFRSTYRISISRPRMQQTRASCLVLNRAHAVPFRRYERLPSHGISVNFHRVSSYCSRLLVAIVKICRQSSYGVLYFNLRK